MTAADKQQRDDLCEQFNTERTREPTLLVRAPGVDRWRSLPLKLGQVQALDELGCKVRVLSFYPHFARDQKTNKPINLSNERSNPAALVEIDQKGKKEKRWVFAKFPDFKMARAERLPYHITLDCPVKRRRASPDFMLVTISGSAHEVWMQYKDQCTAETIRAEKRINVSGSRYTFHIARFVPSGRLIEKYVPSEKRGRLPCCRSRSSAPAVPARSSGWNRVGRGPSTPPGDQ